MVGRRRKRFCLAMRQTIPGGTPQKVDVSSKDAFPDLSATPKAIKVQKMKSEEPAVDSKVESADGEAAPEKGTGRKRRRPKRQTVKLDEL